MAKFIGYCTYTNEDAVVLTQDEYSERGGLPDDWAEYVWIEATDKSEAYARYDEAIQAYEDDNKAGRPIKETY